MRVPVPDGSLVDLTFTPKRATTRDEVNALLKAAAEEGPLKGVLDYSEDPLVSIDIVHTPASSTVDSLETAVIDGTLVRVVSWYDNEWGFSNRMGRHRERDGEAGVRTGRLLGIARHAYSKAPIEVIGVADVSLAEGIRGDFRGAMKGKPHARQVTLLELGDWETALAEVGAALPWQERRANLLVDLDLPQTSGALVRIGAEVILEITRETDPCERMDALAPGLRAALLPDWRGGTCAMVRTGGRIAVGDAIRIEEPWPSLSELWTTSETLPVSVSSSARI